MDTDSHGFRIGSKTNHAEIGSCGVGTIATICSYFYVAHPDRAATVRESVEWGANQINL